MDIKTLAKKPELVEVVLDGEDILKEYGEPITFYMKDFVDINTYFDFFRSQQEKSGEELTKLLGKIILTKDGDVVLSDGETFPIDITLAALTKINETLGKSRAKSLIPNNGKSPK